MVFIQFKKNEKNSFVVEVPLNAQVNQVIARLLQINNTRIYLERLAKSIQQLATKGVLKPQELQGISYDELEKHSKEIGSLSEEKQQYLKKPKAEHPSRYVADKANARYGIILPAEEAESLTAAVKKAQDLLQPTTEVIQKQQYQGAVDDLRMAVMMTYPGYYGLPSWEPVVLLLQNKVEVEQMATQQFPFFEQNANLWFTDKQMEKQKPISEYSGGNNKTRIIVKLQNMGEQQPPRESPVDKESYKNMVQYYYKSKEQHQKFEKESIATVYENPDWSKKSMREDAHLSGPIRFKPM